MKQAISKVPEILQQSREQDKPLTDGQKQEVSRQFSEKTAKSLATPTMKPKYFDLLWSRLAEIYGHKLTSSYGEALPDAWRTELEGMRPEQIKRGLQQCVDSKNPWPPSLPEFVDWCHGAGTDWQHNTAAYRPIPKNRRLEHKCDPEKAREALNAMKSACGSGAYSRRVAEKEPENQPAPDIENLRKVELSDKEKRRREELAAQVEQLGGSSRANCDANHDVLTCAE